MPRFFNRIRKQLAKENKFFQYSRYAIGEILLVVIGILIALQIDNWNDKRKNKERIDELFNNMLVELDADIEDIKGVLRYYHRKDSAIYLILNDKLTVDDYWNNKVPYIENIETNYNIVTPREDSYNELKKYYENFPENYKPIIPDVTQLYLKDYNGLQTWNNKMKEHHFDNIEHRATFDWFTETYPNEKFIDYCVNSFDRKNRVKVYQGYARNHYYQMMRALRNASSLYKKIALLLNNPEVDNNYAFDTETLNLWKGKYQQESDEKNELIVYDDEGKLFWHSINDTTRMEIIPITDTKGFSNRLGFITLLKEKEHTYLKGNDYSYTKKVNSD